MGLFLLSCPAVLGTPREEPEASHCARLGLAQRTGQESCWVKFYLGDHRTLCVDHANWIRWLRLPSPGRICLDSPLAGTLDSSQNGKFNTQLNAQLNASGKNSSRNSSSQRWKAYSPPLNNATSSGEAKKITLYRRNITLASGHTSHSNAPSHSNTPSHPSGLEQKPRAITLLVLQKIESIRERTSATLAELDAFGILRSLLVNEKTSQAPVSLLRKIGFVHLATATGIHLYALARGWDTLLRFVFYSLRLPTHVGIGCSRILSFVLCLCVWMLSGARVGMLRPWIVLTLREISTFLGFRWRRASPLFLALALDLGVACFWAWTGREGFGPSGRVIYALAVGGGLMWCRNFKSVHTGLAIGSWLLVAIWEAWHTGSVALFTPILSLISLPLVCFFIFPLIIASIFLGELGFLKLSEFVMRELSWSLSFLIERLARFAFTYGNFWVVSRSALLWAFFLASLICVFQFHRPWKRTISAWVIASLLAVRSLLEFLPPPSLPSLLSPLSPLSPLSQVEQLDVGQGDAALIRGERTETSGRGRGLVGMMDAGSQHALSDEAWVQLLATRQITRLNWAAISHLDEDHSGGFLRLARLIRIDCITMPQAQLESLRGRKYERIFLDYALKIRGWNSGCIPYPSFSPDAKLVALAPGDQLNPRRKQTTSRPKRPNENMGAIWVPLKEGGFYLAAGDANQNDEILIGKWAARLAARGPENQKRILKISHHGSKSSSAPEFLKQIHPTEVWISAGRGNRYGHPAPVVMERLLQLAVPIRRTDEEGVIYSSYESGSSIQIHTLRRPTKAAIAHHPPQTHPQSPRRRRHSGKT